MINDWITADGLVVVFMTIAAINAAMYLTTIVLYLKGKSFRIWIHDANLLERTGLN